MVAAEVYTASYSNLLYTMQRSLTAEHLRGNYQLPSTLASFPGLPSFVLYDLR